MSPECNDRIDLFSSIVRFESLALVK